MDPSCCSRFKVATRSQTALNPCLLILQHLNAAIGALLTLLSPPTMGAAGAEAMVERKSGGTRSCKGQMEAQTLVLMHVLFAACT